MNFTNWLICFNSKCQNFYSCFFFLKTRTHAQISILKRWPIFHPHFLVKTLTGRDMNFTNWLICFNSKCQNFYSYFFSENTHIRTDIDFKEVADFSSAFSSQNTHTRTDMNFTKWLICFISKCLNFYLCFVFVFVCFCFFCFCFCFLFWKYAYTHRYRCYKDGLFFIPIFGQNTRTQTDINFTQWMISFTRTHTHRCRCYKDGRFFIRIFKKMAHTHRYELTKWLISFISKCLNFYPAFFFLKTHTRTDINFTKWLIFFISKCLNFYPCFFFWKYAHTQRYRCCKYGRF